MEGAYDKEERYDESFLVEVARTRPFPYSIPSCIDNVRRGGGQGRCSSTHGAAAAKGDRGRRWVWSSREVREI